MIAIRPLLLLVAAISFGLGISLPLMELKKLYIFSETPSLIGVTTGLWGAKDYSLAAIVALFSIVFPIVKLAVSFEAVFMKKEAAKLGQRHCQMVTDGRSAGSHSGFCRQDKRPRQRGSATRNMVLRPFNHSHRLCHLRSAALKTASIPGAVWNIPGSV